MLWRLKHFELLAAIQLEHEGAWQVMLEGLAHEPIGKFSKTAHGMEGFENQGGFVPARSPTRTSWSRMESRSSRDTKELLPSG